ncbi:MAG: hypothetical protein QXL16_01275 [Candidatus Micrarchaeaceae archaeon]
MRFKAKLTIEPYKNGDFNILKIPDSKSSKVIIKERRKKIEISVEANDASKMFASMMSIIKQIRIVNEATSIIKGKK